ncbi:MAG: TIGR03986 family CRISPR-associated RAMP protein [Pirellulales bacterium]
MNPQRWRISGTFTTTSPLHIGSGEMVTFDHPSLKDGDDQPNDIQAVVRDYRGLPCIPGSALKGVLRSWAEQRLPTHQCALARIFGERDVASASAESGWAEFCTAHVQSPSPEKRLELSRCVPYWNDHAFTGILSHVSIQRDTGAAAPEKLFFEEYVPEGISFAVEIHVARLNRSDIELLLAILEQGSQHPTHPLHFGGNGADGWGRMNWHLETVQTCVLPEIRTDQVGFDYCIHPCHDLQLPSLTPQLPAFVTLQLQLDLQGPFLVNDSSRTKPAGCSAEDKRLFTDFFPLRRADGRTWLPASSLRGSLRERAEFLLQSLTGDRQDPSGDGPIERLFGTTGQRARLTIAEPCEKTECRLDRRQDFVALDRFTGGAAEGAKFDATYAERPTLEVQLTLGLEGLQPEDVALFRTTLQDVCEGRVPFGWGGSKGYGDATGRLNAGFLNDVDLSWQMPESTFHHGWDTATATWVRHQLATIYRPAPASPTTPPQTTTPAVQVYRGTLTVQQTRRLAWEYVLVYVDSKTKKDKSVKPPEVQIHSSLRQRAASGVEIEFEIEDGKQVRIYPNGTPRQTLALHPLRTPDSDEFAHPYYFLRLEDRKRCPEPLRDRPPVGHRRWIAGRYSGYLRVTLTAKTPLLICDDQRRNPDPQVSDHFIYPIRTDSQGRPQLAASSVRGMLRSAYEAITNSRFGVFPFDAEEQRLSKRANARRLGYRMNAGEGLGLVPVQIANGTAVLLMGETAALPAFDADRRRWRIPGALYAAWVPHYVPDVAGYAPGAITIGGAPPVHGQKAWCWLELMKHNRIGFTFWRVRQAGATSSGITHHPPAASPSSGSYSSCGQFLSREGYFVISNQNIKNKHDERFFFGTAVPAKLENQVLDRYLELIRDCQDIHADEVQARAAATPPRSPTLYTPSVIRHGRVERAEVAAMSRHAYDSAAASLSGGVTLCYASVEKTSTAYVIKSLFPVMISRELFDKTPLDLLPSSLRPATSIDELSPADHVFGWVNQAPTPADRPTAVAYRSHVRVRTVSCETESALAIDTFDQPKTLAILGQPKPQQGRFYLGNKEGRAQVGDRDKATAGYQSENRIRGPKVYPHHKDAEHYVTADQWQRDHPQAFSEERSNQNRSITGWVKPGVTFSFDLQIINLSSLELGALVWLLSLPEGHYLRLGLGKPLGFGSARVEMVEDESCIADGAEWIKSLAAQTKSPAHADLAACRHEFEATVNRVNAELLAAFKIAAAGFGQVPIHYPLTTAQSPGAGETFEWFVANEKAPHPQVLPDLVAANPFVKKLRTS